MVKPDGGFQEGRVNPDTGFIDEVRGLKVQTSAIYGSKTNTPGPTEPEQWYIHIGPTDERVGNNDEISFGLRIGKTAEIPQEVAEEIQLEAIRKIDEDGLRGDNLKDVLDGYITSKISEYKESK